MLLKPMLAITLSRSVLLVGSRCLPAPMLFSRYNGTSLVRASALARLQAQSGPVVTNLIHRPVHMDGEASLALLRAMDGTRDRAALLEAVRAAAASDDGEAIFEDLERNIDRLAKLALLEA